MFEMVTLLWLPIMDLKMYFRATEILKYSYKL